MTHRVSWLRVAAAFCVVGAAWSAAPAHAGMFDDNEARRAVLDLRSKSDNLASQLSAAQRTILDQSGRIDQLNQQVATLRGENEDLTNRLTTLERQQKEYYQDLDTRLKKFEPQQATIDGVEGTVQPGETDALSARSSSSATAISRLPRRRSAASSRSIRRARTSRPRNTGSATRNTHCATTAGRRRRGRRS
jgi:chromosome segregation ATPase